MTIVSCDGLCFSGLAWAFKLLPSTHTQTHTHLAYGVLDHSPVHLRDQHLVT